MALLTTVDPRGHRILTALERPPSLHIFPDSLEALCCATPARPAKIEAVGASRQIKRMISFHSTSAQKMDRQSDGCEYAARRKRAVSAFADFSRRKDGVETVRMFRPAARALV